MHTTASLPHFTVPTGARLGGVWGGLCPPLSSPGRLYLATFANLVAERTAVYLRQPFTITSASHHQALEHCQAPPLNTIIIQSPLNTNTLYSLWNVRHSILQITQGRAKADYRWLVQTHILILIGRWLSRFLLRGRIFPKISWTPCRPPSPWLPWRVDRHMWGTPGPWHGWWQWWLTQATSASAYWDISGSLHSNGICKRGPKLLLLVATSKSDPQSLLLSIHRPTHYAVSGTSPLLQETFIIHLFYHTCFLHSADSVFILVVLGFWHNGSKLAVLLAC